MNVKVEVCLGGCPRLWRGTGACSDSEYDSEWSWSPLVSCLFQNPKFAL